MENNFSNKYELLNKLRDGEISVDDAFSEIKKIKSQINYNNSLVYCEEFWEEQNIENYSEKREFQNVILFDTDENLYKLLKEKVSKSKITLVLRGKDFKELSRNIYTINEKKYHNYVSLFEKINSKEVDIIYLWNKESQYSDCKNMNEDQIECDLDKSFYSIFYISKCLMKMKEIREVIISYVYSVKNKHMNPFNDSIGSFFRDLINENPKFKYKVIKFKNYIHYEPLINEILSNNYNSEWKIIESQRFIKKIGKVNLDGDEEQALINEDGTYIITGGLGGVGTIIAENLSKKYKCNVVLVGRSDLTKEKAEVINTLNTLNSNVIYYKCDVSNKQNLNDLLNEIKVKYKKINGIFHTAGVIRDSFIVNKTKREIEEVFQSKVNGTLCITNKILKEDLDFLVLFSSVSTLGSSGQCDYAFANNFMNKYAKSLKKDGVKNIFSISWPIWENGGMKVTKEYKDKLMNEGGLSLLNDKLAMEALKKVIIGKIEEVIVFSGNEEKLSNLIKELNKLKIKEPQNRNKQNISENSNIVKKAENYFMEIVSKETGIKRNKISTKDSLDNYGIDSIVIMNLNKVLEKEFGEISKTLFFEYQTISEVTKYFLENYTEKLLRLLGEAYEGDIIKTKEVETPKKIEQETKYANRFIKKEEIEITDIAIIGLSGYYPMAENIDEFWQNLIEGKDCIREVPIERWDYKKYFNPNKDVANKCYSKWGGFIDNVDKFDPLFFNISPKEALVTDPQERLFLQTAWNTIEDAGYCKQQISGKKIGVFVGAMYGNYQLNGASKSMQEVGFIPSSSYASIANRVSYFFNLNGPSMAIDTMCSSSLVSIHLACESILNGESEIAIAGGVNLMTHPNKYLQLSQGKYLASDGRCHSFGEGGDGYVPGEGVGAVLIKPLNKAIADNDYIYGVIKGSAVNHGGRTNGYSVPNPRAQSLVIEKAIEKAKINPKDITYVEAHGTGTELGDPIEVQGLTKSYRKYTSDNEYCLIGSLKSNIGHLESAAGIAALTKVLLQMKYNKIVPTINCDNLNKNINFKETPFKVARSLCNWNEKENNKPKIAAISAFGAGGTNCHLIVESFDNKKDNLKNEFNIIVLSAKTEEGLKKYAYKLKESLNYRLKKSNSKVVNNKDEVKPFIEKYLSQVTDIDKKQLYQYNSLEEYDLDIISLEMLLNAIEDKFNIKIALSELLNITIDELVSIIINSKNSAFFEESIIEEDELEFSLEQLAYTMQSGREHFSKRLAIVASDFKDLVKKLDDYILGISNEDNIYEGEVNEKYTELNDLYSSEEGKIFLKSLAITKEYNKLAMLWISGIEVQWDLLYEHTPKKYSVVNYPFDKESYWIPNDKYGEDYKLSENIKENVSTLNSTAFRSIFNKKLLSIGKDLRCSENTLIDFYMLQLGIEAVNLIEDKSYNSIRDIVWGEEINLEEENVEFYTELYKNKSYVEYQVLNNNKVCAKGKLVAVQDKINEKVNINLETDKSFEIKELEDNKIYIFKEITMCINFFLKEVSEDYYNLKSIKEVKFNNIEIKGKAIINIFNIYLEKDLIRFSIGVVNELGEVILKLKEVILNKIKIKETIINEEFSRNLIDNDKSIEEDINNIICSLLDLSKEKIDDSLNFYEYGFDSIAIKSMAKEISKLYNIDFSAVVLFDNGTTKKLIKYLKENYIENIQAKYNNKFKYTKKLINTSLDNNRERLDSLKERYEKGFKKVDEDEIAIVGVSGIFPESRDLNEFWKNIEECKNLITEIPKERWDWEEFTEGKISTNSKYGGFIPDVDKFDAKFFNISPMEAEMMDPQQRLFLQTAWKVIEDGGYKVSDLSGEKVGLFVGLQFSDYQKILSDEGILNPLMGLGNEHCILVNRVSYMFNFRGPSEVYNTACSSSLVAIHRAVESIKSGESKMAIAGGISLMLSPYTMISAEQMGILSSDGKCKTLDESGDGYVKGEGVGAVLLMPLKEAIKDNHHIYGIIKASAVNHGGKATSLTAPNSTAEKELIIDAMKKGKVFPNDVTYLELHGTGTQLGDPIEIEAIKKAFKEYSDELGIEIKNKHCGIGTVKTNIGHLEPAAGIAGFLKVIMSIKNKKLPGILHLKNLNPYVELDNSPFYIVKETTKWERLQDENGNYIPRIAGVSSFGFGGVNAHVIVEEYENNENITSNETEEQIIVLSAKSKNSIREYVLNLFEYIQNNKDISLEYMAYTLQICREDMKYRVAFVVNTLEELEEKLKEYISKNSQNVIESSEIIKESYDLDNLISNKKYIEISRLWVNGNNIDFNLLWNNRTKKRITLPTYPFERNSYWIKKTERARTNIVEKIDNVKTSSIDRGEISKVIKRIIFEILKVNESEIDENVNLSDYGLDSILSTTIIKLLEERLNVLVPINEISNNNTVNKLSEYIYLQIKDVDIILPTTSIRDLSISKTNNEKIPKELITLNSSGKRQTSFWVHGGPGYATFFTKLSEKLGGDYPFYAFQAKGVDGITIPHDFDDMVDHYIKCIKMIQKEGPYIIGGYSSGGLIAYEMVRKLTNNGDKIDKLIMLDTLPVTNEALEKIKVWHSSNKDFIILMMANEIAKSKKANKNLIGAEDLENVSDLKKVAHVAKLIKKRTDIKLSEDEIYDYIIGSIRLNEYVEDFYATYSAQKYTGSQVIYFKAEKGFISESNWMGYEVEDVYKGYSYTDYWGELIGENLSVINVPSDHFNILGGNSLNIVSNTLAEIIQ